MKSHLTAACILALGTALTPSLAGAQTAAKTPTASAIANPKVQANTGNVAIAAATTAAAVDSVQLKGHSYPKTIQLEVRYKFIVPVYTAALYTEKPVKSEAEFLAAPGSKRLILTMLRKVDSNELGYMFAKAMKVNIDPKDMVTALPGLARMGQVFADAKAVNPGDTIIMDWMGKGKNTVIAIRNEVQGEPFADAAFHRALMGVWLGKNAADAQLKKALLGN